MLAIAAVAWQTFSRAPAKQAGDEANWRYPAWQFEDGTPRPGVARVVATARDRKLDETRLYDLLTTPLGLREGGGRLVDLLVNGREDEVVAAIRAAS